MTGMIIEMSFPSFHDFIGCLMPMHIHAALFQLSYFYYEHIKNKHSAEMLHIGYSFALCLNLLKFSAFFFLNVNLQDLSRIFIRCDA